MNEEQFKALYKLYRDVSLRAGVMFECLSPDKAGEEGAAVAAYQAQVVNEEGEMTIRIQGPFDPYYGVNVNTIIRDLDEAEGLKKLNLLIESPGGFVTDGFKLYSDLRARARNGLEITAESRGLVASAAVLPFLAADERLLGDATNLMVHNIWGIIFAIGDADELESEAAKTVKAMRSLGGTYTDILAERTGMTKRVARNLMKEETWYNREEAIDAGLATGLASDPIPTPEPADDDDLDDDLDLFDAEELTHIKGAATRAMAQFRLSARDQAKFTTEGVT